MASVFSTIALSSIRYHYLSVSFWLIFQVIFGLLLANGGVIEYSGQVLVDVRGKVSNDELFNFHSLSGKFLLGMYIIYRTQNQTNLLLAMDSDPFYIYIIGILVRSDNRILLSKHLTTTTTTKSLLAKYSFRG